jgi:hypothetical protein
MKRMEQREIYLKKLVKDLREKVCQFCLRFFKGALPGSSWLQKD